MSEVERLPVPRRKLTREQMTDAVGPDGAIVDGGRTWITGCGEMVLNIHNGSQCQGRACVIHNPSDHSMRSFRTHFRSPGPFDIKPAHVERICSHGIGHPDPDDLAYQKIVGEEGMGVHGCDGCCTGNILLDSPAEGGDE